MIPRHTAKRTSCPPQTTVQNQPTNEAGVHFILMLTFPRHAATRSHTGRNLSPVAIFRVFLHVFLQLITGAYVVNYAHAPGVEVKQVR